MREFLSDFRETVNAGAKAMLLLSEPQSELATAPGKWSPKQVIGHLIDSAGNNHGRFVRAQLQDDLTFTGYQQEEWVNRQRYQTEPWKDLVELWRLYNLHLAHLLEQVSVEDLTRPRTNHNLDQIAWQTVPRSEPVTLEYFIRDYVAHLKNHLRQIPGPHEV